jgi:CBS domain-containing protein
MRADAVVVLDESTRVPLGIITLPDVVRRIAIEGCDLQAPIAAVMTSGLITVPADGTVHQASVVMVRRGVRHLVLTEADGSYFNLVSQSDLYTLPGAQSTTWCRRSWRHAICVRWLAWRAKSVALLSAWSPSE